MQANKALVQLTGAMATVALPMVTRGFAGELSTTEWINVAVSMAGAGSVYIAANQEDAGIWAYTKAIFSGMATGLVLLISFLTDGVQAGEWTQVIVVFLATGAVALVGNDDEVVPGRHRTGTEPA